VAKFSEYGNWEDNGCSFHNSCFTCPFNTCYFDLPIVIRGRTEEAIVAVMKGANTEDLASRFGVSKRTAYRWKVAAKQLVGDMG
jgi:hypothetical protein